MDQSPLGNALGHLAQMAMRQSQIHHAQNEPLVLLYYGIKLAICRSHLVFLERGHEAPAVGEATESTCTLVGTREPQVTFV
ncbi:unnamed protein product [Boreogadus saida]